MNIPGFTIVRMMIRAVGVATEYERSMTTLAKVMPPPPIGDFVPRLWVIGDDEEERWPHAWWDLRSM